MDSTTWVAIADVVGALSVALTLPVLVVSVRQNTQSQKALAVESLAAAIAAINVPAIQSAQVGAAVANASADWGAASREDRIIAHYFLFSLFKLNENAWFQQKAKILDRAQWLGWETVIRRYYHSKGVREVWWPNRRHAYAQDYQDFLAATTPPENIGSLSDLFDYVPRPEVPQPASAPAASQNVVRPTPAGPRDASSRPE
jgi:hypothetical protein